MNFWGIVQRPKTRENRYEEMVVQGISAVQQGEEDIRTPSKKRYEIPKADQFESDVFINCPSDDRDISGRSCKKRMLSEVSQGGQS